jgi:hypothetical protein
LIGDAKVIFFSKIQKIILPLPIFLFHSTS